MHRNCLSNVIASPMLFFDTTPVGRILNRFSKDIDTLDVIIAVNIDHWFLCFLEILCVPIVLGYSTPMIIVTLLPLAVLYVAIQVGAFFITKQSTLLLSKQIYLFNYPIGSKQHSVQNIIMCDVINPFDFSDYIKFPLLIL